MTLSGILEMIHTAAEHQIISHDTDMAEEHARQRQAVDSVGDWLTNHHKEIDDRFSGELRDAVAKMDLPEIDLEVLRACASGPFHDEVCTVMELSCQAWSADLPHARAFGIAIDIAALFWTRHGATICSEIRSYDTDAAP